MASFRRNLLSNASASAVSSGVQFLLILALPNWLPVNAFASFLTAVAVIAIGEMVSDFGGRILAIKEFAASQQPKCTLFASIVAKGGYSFVLAFLMFLLPLNLLNWELVAIIICIAVTQPSTDPLLWHLIGRERIDIEAVVQLAWRIANVFLIGILAYEGAGLEWILSAWLCVNLLRIILVWHSPFMNTIRYNACNFSEALSRGISIFRSSFSVGIAFILMTLYQRLGVLLLGEITSAHSVAIYGVAFTLVASAGFVATSITLASFPILSKSLAENNWSEVHEAVERKLMLIMTVYLPACIAGSLIAPWVISSIYSSSYKDVPLIMYALLPGLYISSINFALKYFMNGIKLNWHDALSAFVGILVFIVFLMIPKWKDAALMAGWAWGLGEVSNYLMKWYAIKRYFKQVSLDLMRHLITFIVLITVFFLLQDYYRAWVNSFYS